MSKKKKLPHTRERDREKEELYKVVHPDSKTISGVSATAARILSFQSEE